MLCTLALSAIGAQSATAATKGTTAFTCKETGAGGGFTKAHCKAADAGSGKFSHVAIPQDTTTEVTISNETTGGESLASQLMLGSGDTVTGVAPEVSGSGWLKNVIDPGTGEHYIHGEFALTYSGITESLLGCEVFKDNGGGEKGAKGVVQTTTLTFTTKGLGDYVRITPKEGAPFASAIVAKCASFEGTLKWVGSVKCPVDGATILCDKEVITAEKTLRVGSLAGPVSGIFGSYTLKGRANSSDTYQPISPTTIETT
ncbi:MAG TPA: hypothetical protein VLL27_13920 [Solirubrobacterales bacterium]|nr:hypothetical protein [Solirubrobacterales bacterium]